MDLHKIFLYNLLPKKRIFIAFIGFLISSTIITGGGILMLNIIESTSSYLGESEDVLVLSNPRASTPYTSILPMDLAETINSLYGVIDVSPEVMTAAVYKQTAVYFRGVDVTKFADFMDVEYLDGGYPVDKNDTFDVSIGINFAERNNLEAGDFLTVFSTRSDSALELRVKSIFYSGTLLDDEIIAPLWIGQFFSFESYNYITHIRVKIDLEIIPDKEILREIVNSEHELTVNVFTPNSLEELNGTLYIRNTRGDILREEIFYNTDIVQLVLPFGEYMLQVEVGNEFSDPHEIILLSNSTVNIYVPYVQREVNVRVETDEDEPIEGARVQIFKQSAAERALWSDSYSKYTDSNGEVSFTVSNNSYYVEASYERYRKSVAFVTMEVNNIEIVLIDRHPSISVNSPINFSIFIGKSLNISVSATTGYSIYFYTDGNLLTIQEYFLNLEGERPPPSINVPFEVGPHSITFVAYNEDYPGSGDKSRNYAEKTVYFTMSQDFPVYFTFNKVMNGSQILPLSTLTFNSSLYFSKDILYRWDSDTWKEVLYNSIPAPPEIGIHKLTLKAETEDFSRSWVFYFSVTNIVDFIGILGMSSFKIIKGESPIQVWYDKLASSVLFHWDSDIDISVPQDGIISAQNLSDGFHSLNLSIYKNSQWYFKTYEIKIDNFAPNITLSVVNGTSLDTGSIISFIHNETLSWLKYTWDNQAFSRVYNNNITVPEENGIHSLKITACDLAGNLINYFFEFTIVNFTGGSPIDFYLFHEYSGFLNQNFIDLNIITDLFYFSIEYNIIGPINLTGLLLESKRIHLYPGLYTLEIIFSLNIFEHRTRTWNFEIFNHLNSSLLTSQFLNSTYSGDILVTVPYFDFTSLLNENSSLFLVDGRYDLTHELAEFPGDIFNQELIFDTLHATMTIISPDFGNEEMTVLLELSSDAVEIYFSLDLETIVYKYEGEVFLEYSSPGKHTISFTLIDCCYIQTISVYTFYVGLEYLTMNLTIQTKSGDNVIPYTNLSLAVNSIYNGTEYIITSDVDGRVYFNIFPGEFYVSLNIGLQNYIFTFNSNEGLIQSIFIGLANVTVIVQDYYVGVPIRDQYCIIRDYSGNRIKTVKADHEGKVDTTLSLGDYICYFPRSNSETIAVPFQVFKPNSEIVFAIPSPRRFVEFQFRYDNGSQIYNLPLIFSTVLEGEIETTTALSSIVNLFISYGRVNITVFLKNGDILSLQRTFEPGKEIIEIIINSETEDEWLKIPFKPISGFDFLVSLSYEYMDYYLKGSLLFTYTLAYAEVILILIIVIVNMFTILQNVYRESRRETTIVRMIGGTNLYTLFVVFIRIGLIASVASFLGYGIGASILRLLARANQTVFFGHTFTPTGSVGIFFLNVVLMIFVAIISSLLIARRVRQEKSIVYTRRRR